MQDGDNAAQPAANGRGEGETAAAGTGTDDGPAPQPPDAGASGAAVDASRSSDPVPVENEVLAEARLDVDGDGTEERLVIRMTKGRKREETEPGPFMGTVREGDVRLELLDAGGAVLHARDVNPDFGGQPLVFDERRDFTLRIDDYNSDGKPEFALGQYVSSNVFSYGLYEVSSDGFRLLLDLISSPHGFTKSFDRIGTRAFKNEYYNLETGMYEKDVYVWTGDRYERATAPDFACDGCRRWDDGWPGLTRVPTDDGFVLVTGEDFHGGPLHVSPKVGGQSYIIHELARHESFGTAGNAGRISSTAVIVDAVTGGVTVVPLYRSETSNLYQASIIAHGQGFLPDGQWVFVAAESGGEAGTRYQLKKLNPATGEATLLAPELPGAEEFDYAASWLTRDGSKFVLLGNETGRLWVIDLADGNATLLKERFATGWPFVYVHPSPDGRRFWYEDHEREEYRYYDLAGNVLASFPFSEGMANHPPLVWSHDGRYAVFSDTFEKDHRHVIGSDGDSEQIAAQRLSFRDQNGRLVRTLETEADGEYVALAGWPAAGGDTVLIERYRLSDQTDMIGYRVKTDRRYALLDLKTGRETGLSPVDRPAPDRITDAFFLNFYGPVALVDRKGGRLAVQDNVRSRSVRLAESGDGLLAWTVTDREAWTGRLYLWDMQTGRLSAWSIPMTNEFLAVAGKWWYTTGLAAHRLESLAGNGP